MANTGTHRSDNQKLTHCAIEKVVREDWGKLLACLITSLNDFQLAEDALQDALESALQHWQRNGLPRSSSAWLLQTARRKAIDRLRRTANFKVKQTEYQLLLTLDQQEVVCEHMYAIPDERLRLIFTCCHPALHEKTRIALTLHTLCGLKTAEIAQAFLDNETTMAQRLVRGKRKIKAAAIPYEVPSEAQWGERLDTVLSVLYLIFNAGYFSAHGESQIRLALSNEAIRLAKILLQLKPEEPEVGGLLALMLLHDSRRTARQTTSGEMIPLDQQNRDQWDTTKISLALKILEKALSKYCPGPYQIQAAISAIHAEAKSHTATNWHEIALLYLELYKFQPNPVVLLNRCVAVSYANSPEAALVLLSDLGESLANYQPFFATQADLLRRNNKVDLAKLAYLQAIELSDEDSTRQFLEKRLKEIS